MNSQSKIKTFFRTSQTSSLQACTPLSGYCAANWRIRSANATNANNVANVNSSGYVNNNNSTNANGVAPDCSNVAFKCVASSIQQVIASKLCSEMRSAHRYKKNKGIASLTAQRSFKAAACYEWSQTLRDVEMLKSFVQQHNSLALKTWLKLEAHRKTAMCSLFERMS